MIGKVISTSRRAYQTGLLRKQIAPVHDWSHIYDGIYKF